MSKVATLLQHFFARLIAKITEISTNGIELPHSDPNDDEEEEEDEEEIEGRDGEIFGGADMDGPEKRGFNLGEIDGLYCPICFEAWSSVGDHHVCCLPCGHLYGLSCIEKWLGSQSQARYHRLVFIKCPQCKQNCGIKDIRLLYATQVVTADEELQMRVKSLEAKCVSLEKESRDWSKKEVQWKKTVAGLRKEVRDLKRMKIEGRESFRRYGTRSLW